MNIKNRTRYLTKAFTLLPVALATSLILTNSALADQVILDDLIVDGSACLGFDCVNGESFGFDTLRLKENNLRIKFQDTSSSASFPSNDWQITANDSANGGANKFSIDDIDSGKTPFTLEAGAPSHSLYVDDGGRLGLGTSTPVVDLHIKSGNTPTLRLEQDGSSGFTPQIWDVAGNEANFFIRDATNGSTLPFRIFPGAPSNALSIAADGDVGVGTTTPVGRFDVRNSVNTKTLFSISDTGDIGIGHGAAASYYGVQANLDIHGETGEASMIGISIDESSKNSSIAFVVGDNRKWLISSRNQSDSSKGATNDRLIIKNSISEEIFTIHQNGNIYIGNSPSNVNNTNHALESSTGAYLTAGGVWTNASSRALKNNIEAISEVAALDALKYLNPVTYIYNSEPNEVYAGFIAEEVPDIVAMKDKKSIATMDIVAILTKVVQMQDRKLAKLNARLEKIEQ